MKRPQHKVQPPIFVYGTLRRGEKNYAGFFEGRTEKELPGTIRGELYFVADGGYPYVVPGDSAVRGELMEIIPAIYETTLRALDELEEYDPQNEKKSVYLRRRTAVRLDDGAEVTAWTYYWNCPQIVGERVESGDFKKRVRSEEKNVPLRKTIRAPSEIPPLPPSTPSPEPGCDGGSDRSGQ